MRTAMLFIDGSNVFYDWQYLHRNNKADMDIVKYISHVKSLFPDTVFKRTYYFTAASEENSSFLQFLSRLPYVEVITGRLQEKQIYLAKYDLSCSSCKTHITDTVVTQVDKGTDVNIAVKMLQHAFNHSYDLAVLISRDADFVSVVDVIKDLGLNIETVFFEGAVKAQELSEHVDATKIIHTSDLPLLART